MTPGAQLDALLSELHWSRRTLGGILGRTETTVRRWASTEPPAAVLAWLQRLAAFHRRYPGP